MSHFIRYARSTPTPRTDAFLSCGTRTLKEIKDFARQLERELAEAKAENERLAKLELAVIQTKEIDKLKAERDKLRAAYDILFNYWFPVCEGGISSARRDRSHLMAKLDAALATE